MFSLIIILYILLNMVFLFINYNLWYKNVLSEFCPWRLVMVLIELFFFLCLFVGGFFFIYPVGSCCKNSNKSIGHGYQNSYGSLGYQRVVTVTLCYSTVFVLRSLPGSFRIFFLFFFLRKNNNFLLLVRGQGCYHKRSKTVC